MTPNIIDEAVERLDFACATESKINMGDVALLLKAFTTSHRMVKEQITQLAASNARIAELEAQLATVNKSLAWINAHNTQIHEVIDDFGESVTAVTL